MLSFQFKERVFLGHPGVCMTLHLFKLSVESNTSIAIYKYQDKYIQHWYIQPSKSLIMDFIFKTEKKRGSDLLEAVTTRICLYI